MTYDTGGSRIPELPSGPPDDGLPAREAKAWARDKLMVLHTYLWHFSMACNGAKRGYEPHPWCYVDVMAGPGVNRFPDGSTCAGSPLIAQAVNEPPLFPAARTLVFAESDSRLSEALNARVAGDSRIRLCTVDVNASVASVLEHVPKRAPCIAFFDPEGFDVRWETLEAFARHKRASHKIELLVMLPLYVGMLRTLFLGSEPPGWVPDAWDAVFGPVDWRETYNRRRAGALDATSAARELVESYRSAFRESLGYNTAHKRLVPATGRPRYWLVFATDHQAGDRIMDAVMNQVFVHPGDQLTLFPPDPARFRD